MPKTLDQYQEENPRQPGVPHQAWSKKTTIEWLKERLDELDDFPAMTLNDAHNAIAQLISIIRELINEFQNLPW